MCQRLKCTYLTNIRIPTKITLIEMTISFGLIIFYLLVSGVFIKLPTKRIETGGFELLHQIKTLIEKLKISNY